MKSMLVSLALLFSASFIGSEILSLSVDSRDGLEVHGDIGARLVSERQKLACLQSSDPNVIERCF